MAGLFFSMGGMVALVGWFALAVSLFVSPVRLAVWTATGIVIPFLLAVAYVVLAARGWGAGPGGGFGSIAEVRTLFGNDDMLAAGWLHYLAFDLLVGTFVAWRGLGAGVHPLLLLLCLPPTFLFGPVGLLLFVLIMIVWRKPPWPRSH